MRENGPRPLAVSRLLHQRIATGKERHLVGSEDAGPVERQADELAADQILGGEAGDRAYAVGVGRRRGDAGVPFDERVGRIGESLTGVVTGTAGAGAANVEGAGGMGAVGAADGGGATERAGGDAGRVVGHGEGGGRRRQRDAGRTEWRASRGGDDGPRNIGHERGFSTDRGTIVVRASTCFSSGD